MTPFTAGAMKLVSWADNERVVMVKNDSYWKKDRPLQDGMVFQIIPELPTGLRSVTAGQNDLVYYLVPQQKQLIDRARTLAQYIEGTMGNQQRLLRAGYSW